jgi:solute:Na+ symporter, SSS family
MAAVFKALGLAGELPRVTAFVVLAVYTYSSGLRAPALIAFVKDTMIYIAVFAAVAIIPIRLGGYAAVFEAADAAFLAKGSGGILLAPDQYLPYATLALGSALAAFMYPHTLTGVFASANTIRKNAILLPAYTLLLGLLALLGYMGHAAGLTLSSNTDVVPALFKTMFPGWFAGFAFAAIAIGALVPAAVMSIGAANLFTRNFWKAYVNPDVSVEGEAHVAKVTSLVVKVGCWRPFICRHSLHSICSCWAACGSCKRFLRWYSRPALLLGWLAGFLGGTWLAWSDGLKPLHTLVFGSTSFSLYVGLLALAINIAVAVVANAILMLGRAHGHVLRSFSRQGRIRS